MFSKTGGGADKQSVHAPAVSQDVDSRDSTEDRGDESGSGSSPGPFFLSEGLPPVPAKLVAKIQRGDYVDMAELLRDNMEMERRQSSDSQGSGRRNRCMYAMYASVLCDKYPDKVRQLFAYQTMLVREVHRGGGKGWMAYDTMFHQQAANNLKVDWSVLNNSLYSTSFLAQQNNRGRTCQWCMETDHISSNCAMAPAVHHPATYRPTRPPQKEGYAEERHPGWASREAAQCSQ